MNLRLHPPEINHRTMKFIVGVIALTLASLTSCLAKLVAHKEITSISESYYVCGWPHDIFVGFLFAIAAFMFAYNGYTRPQMMLSKLAAVSAICIALFPCKCITHEEVIPYVHGISAAAMFGILAFFCRVFYQRALKDGKVHAKRRAIIYALSGVAIIVTIVTLAFDDLSGGMISHKIVRFTFYGERTGLMAFGVSWLTASHWIPGIASKSERLDAHNSPPPTDTLT